MKTVAKNRRARFDYEILDTWEAGIVLTGPEVKSCRSGQVHLGGSYVSSRRLDIILRNATIAPYPYARLDAYIPTRDRVLLVKAGERERIVHALAEKGMSVIPLEVRTGKFVKLLIGLARGRKRHDKRTRIREREMARRLRRGSE